MEPFARTIRTNLSPPSPEDVVSMLDLLDAADLRNTVAGVEGLLRTLRPAAEVPDRLVAVDSDTLKAALVLRARRPRR